MPLPDGAFPTMITPFLNDEHKSVDWEALDCMLIGRTLLMHATLLAA